MKKFVVLLMIFSVLLSADVLKDIKDDLNTRVQKTIELLKNKNIDRKTKDKKAIELVSDIFNYKIMAMLSLGKRRFESLSKAQREEFVSLFRKKIEKFYIEKLDQYSGQKLIVEDAKRVKKTRIEVVAKLFLNNEAKDIVYKYFYSKKSKKWYIYDIDVDKISMIKTYRAQFDSIINSESFDGLLKRLRTGTDIK
jgi:phospholipid transport system substrate-binding protein